MNLLFPFCGLKELLFSWEAEPSLQSESLSNSFAFCDMLQGKRGVYLPAETMEVPGLKNKQMSRLNLYVDLCNINWSLSPGNFEFCNVTVFGLVLRTRGRETLKGVLSFMAAIDSGESQVSNFFIYLQVATLSNNTEIRARRHCLLWFRASSFTAGDGHWSPSLLLLPSTLDL